jgi:hypothetical protein
MAMAGDASVEEGIRRLDGWREVERSLARPCRFYAAGPRWPP